MISAIERGVHLPGLEVLLTLSQALHIAPNEVLERLELGRGEFVDSAGLSYEEADRRAGECFWAGEHHRAVAYYDAILRHLVENGLPDPAELRRRTATTEIRRAAALRRCGASTAARAGVERAISITDDLPELQSQAYVVLVALLVQLGCLPLARDAAERAVELSRGCPPSVQGWAWVEKGEVLSASGRYAEARAAFLEARRHVRESGNRKHQISVEGNIGICLRGLERPQQARSRYLRAVKLARRFEIPAAEAFWLVELGRLAFDEGRLEQADAYAQAALSTAGADQQRLTRFRAEWLRHQVQRSRDPSDTDRHRVAYLRRLYTRLDQHRGVPEIQEFTRAYCTPGSAGGSS